MSLLGLGRVPRAAMGRALPPRRGISFAGTVFAIGAMTVVTAALVWRYRERIWPPATDDLVTHKVHVDTFIHDVTERGEVQSYSNVELRCEVQSRNMSGVAIIEIVPEGTLVKKGDFLVQLDDSALQTDRTAQQIAVSSSAALVSQAVNDLESAQVAKLEYEFGTFKQEDEKLQSELFVAEENFRRAEEYLRYSQKLAARGYVSPIQLEADRFAVEKARKELDVAKTKLEVLNKYTKLKTIKKHEADIKTNEAKFKAEEAKHQLEVDKLNLIESQIAKCTIIAPEDGQVLYNHEMDDWRGNEDMTIKAGTLVRERQVIIRLPDPKKMHVETKISESRVDLVKVEMAATIQIDALPGTELRGIVRKVNAYPAAGHWMNQSVKEYEGYVEIQEPPAGLRPGMTAQVSIRVETTPDAMQVPVQAVVERNGKHYCLLTKAGKLEPREVLIGATNDKFLIIRDGLLENEEVVLNPRAHLSKVVLPGAPTATPIEVPKLAANESPGRAAPAPAESPGT